MRKFVALVLFALLTPLARAADALVVEDLRCRGNAATSCEFILGHVYLGRGDTLDEERAAERTTALVDAADFSVRQHLSRKGSERGKAIVVVEVAEADPIVGEWLLGASHRLGAFRSVAAGRLSHQNLFGAGKIADLSAVAVSPLNGPSRNNTPHPCATPTRICSARSVTSQRPACSMSTRTPRLVTGTSVKPRCCGSERRWAAGCGTFRISWSAMAIAPRRHP